MRFSFVLASCLALFAISLSPHATAQSAGTTGDPSGWCAPDLGVLAHNVCYAAAPQEQQRGPRTLVIYLHGVIKPETNWQWGPQRSMAATARAGGFTAIMPRGRRGIGPQGMNDWWTWPTSVSAQQQTEASLIDEWMEAKRALEAQTGKPFEKVYVFGFSNGAYYATSLALRGQLPVDGYAVFAGGSAPKHTQKSAQQARKRVPLFVGYGLKDPTHRQTEELGQALAQLGWKHRAIGYPGIGHAMTDRQIRDALEFLRRP